MQRSGSNLKKGAGRGSNEQRSGRSALFDASLRWFYRNCRWNFLKICIIFCLSVYLIIWIYGLPSANDAKAARVFASTRDLRKRLSYVFSDINEISLNRSEPQKSSSADKRADRRGKHASGAGCSQSPPMPLVYGDLYDVQLEKAHVRRGWIPRIIHQTWKTERIPERFVPYVQSWSTVHQVGAKHGSWLHVLWTDVAMRKFVERYYPTLLPGYDAARFGVIRSDVFRLLVLARFGGVYADLDLEALRPLHSILDRHACLFASEPTLHALGVLERLHFPSNALIACRPGHPFLNYLADKVPELMGATRDDEDKIVFKAGPEVINGALRAFADMDDLQEASEAFCAQDTVYVPSGDVFMPLFEPYDHVTLVQARCRGWQSAAARPFAISLRRYVTAFCDALLDNTMENRVANSSFSVHHWASTYRTEPRAVNRRAYSSTPRVHDKEPLVNVLLAVPSVKVLDVSVDRDRELLERAGATHRSSDNDVGTPRDWSRYRHLFHFDDIYIDENEQ